jgi:hypothetical protein
MHSFVLLQYFKWHFLDAPREIMKGWGNVLWFGFNYFSVLLLLQTFFSPWRRITWSYGKGFHLGRFFTTLFSNFISRILGAIMRSFLIAAGLGFELFLLIAGGIFFAVWLVLPLLIVLSLFYGIFLLF